MWGYSKRLKHDLTRWREAGWLTADAETNILSELASSGREVGLASSLGILASILLAFAVVSFVAAHWQDMPRAARLGLILTLIWIGYGAAGMLAARGQRAFSDAAILFANAVYGAGIALISQMYHIDGHPPDGVLLWALGAFLSGAALRSYPALALAMILFGVWTAMEMGDSGKVHWPFLAGWGAVTAAFLWQRWRPGVHISGLALTLFITSLGYFLSEGHAHEIVALMGVAVAAIAIAALKFRPELDTISAPALGYAIATAFAGLFALQFVEETKIAGLIAVAAITLLFLLAAIAYGLWHAHRGALWLGYIGFSIEIFALYWKALGTLLDTSMFFLVAGLIVAALAFLATRLASRSQAGRAVA